MKVLHVKGGGAKYCTTVRGIIAITVNSRDNDKGNFTDKDKRSNKQVT